MVRDRFELTFHRIASPAQPEAFVFEPQRYTRHEGKRALGEASFPWDQEVLALLGRLQRGEGGRGEGGADLRHRIGAKLRVFLEGVAWRIPEAAPQGDEGPQLVTISAGAAELYALPWELATLPGTNQHLADLPNLLVRYEWPAPPEATADDERADDSPPRVIFAWSAAGGGVPAGEHTRSIQEAVDHARVRGVKLETVAHVSGAALEAALARDRAPVVLHLLCHGGAGSSLIWNDADGAGRDAIDSGRLGNLLAKHRRRLRLVVLCACHGGDAAPEGSYTGSVAQAIHRLGIPAVLASRYPLSTRGSVRLTRVLYRALLAEGASIERALLRARAALHSERGKDGENDPGDGDGCLSGDAYALQLYARGEEESWPFAPPGRRTGERRAAPEVSTRRLPDTGRELFGRKDELAWLDKCWADGVYVASIVAWGGVGKSALVNAWLARLRDEGWRGAERVFGWSFYNQSSDEFIDAALRWFGDKDPTAGSPWDKGERLAGLVRNQRTLLVLDGVEPLQGRSGMEEGKLKDAALQVLVKELGAQNMGLCLITSRINMTDLEALAGHKVQKQELDQLSEDAGAKLLEVRGAKGSEQELRAAAREYKGHALALTLLGSYLSDVAGGDIRQRKEIGPLEEDERQGEYARRVMVAYEQWLKKPEFSILHMIGLFDRPADEDEIAALRVDPPVNGLTDALMGVDRRAWKQAIARLGRLGLLAEQDNRLDAHPLVREHFGAQLRREQPEAWREGHRRLYKHLEGKAKERPDTVEEMAPLYAAVIHGCLAGKSQVVLDEIYWARVQQWRPSAGRAPRENEHFNQDRLGAFGSEVAVLSAFFDPPWEGVVRGLDKPAEHGVLTSAGVALWALGRLQEAAGLMRRALEGCVAREDWENAAIGASKLSEVLLARGDLREALVVAERSVEYADRSGELYQRMANLTTLADVQHAHGEREQSADGFERAEVVQREREPHHPLLFSLWSFRYCELLLDEGREDDVLTRMRSLFAWRSPRDSLLWQGVDHLSFGRAHFLAARREPGCDLADAEAHLDSAVEILHRAGYQDYLGRGLLARAALHTHTRTLALARKDLDEAFSIATRCGFRLHEAEAHLGYARLSLAEGAPAAARPHLEAARKLVEATGYHRRDGELAELDRKLAEVGAG